MRRGSEGLGEMVRVDGGRGKPGLGSVRKWLEPWVLD